MARKFTAYTDGRYIYEIKEVVPKAWYITAYLIQGGHKGNVHRLLGRTDAKCINRDHWTSKYTAQTKLELAALQKGWKEWRV